MTFELGQVNDMAHLVIVVKFRHCGLAQASTVTLALAMH